MKKVKRGCSIEYVVSATSCLVGCPQDCGMDGQRMTDAGLRLVEPAELKAISVAFPAKTSPMLGCKIYQMISTSKNR
jgi:hypothetical protein